MAKQFVALSEQSARHQLDAVPVYKFYPIGGDLEPEPEFTESAAKEWRAQDTAQGDVTDERTSTAWKYSFKGRTYICAELALLFKHIFGYASTPANLSAPDAAAARTIFRTETEMYGDDAVNLDSAIAVIPNTAKAASTYSQAYVGGRPKGAGLEFKGGEAVDFTADIMGGPWIGAVEQTAIAGVSFPVQTSLLRGIPKIYLGAGATLTGTAPDYTDFAPGTMPMAKPDDLSIKLDSGIKDVWKGNGYEGPSVTEREKQWGITIEYTHDFADPASGWSSYDAWAAYFSGMQYVPVMLVAENANIIPSCSAQKYHLSLYLPKMKLTVTKPERKNDGSKSKIKIKLESRVDPAVNIACFAKLIY